MTIFLVFYWYIGLNQYLKPQISASGHLGSAVAWLSIDVCWQLIVDL